MAAASWATLTPQQEQVFNLFINELRSECATLGQLCNRIAALQTMYLQQIVPVVGSNFVDSVIPNASGLTGSQDLDWTNDIVALYGIMGFILSSINTPTNMSPLVRAAGGLNLIPGTTV